TCANRTDGDRSHRHGRPPETRDRVAHLHLTSVGTPRHPAWRRADGAVAASKAHQCKSCMTRPRPAPEIPARSLQGSDPTQALAFVGPAALGLGPRAPRSCGLWANGPAAHLRPPLAAAQACAWAHRKSRGTLPVRSLLARCVEFPANYWVR